MDINFIVGEYSVCLGAGSAASIGVARCLSLVSLEPNKTAHHPGAILIALIGPLDQHLPARLIGCASPCNEPLRYRPGCVQEVAGALVAPLEVDELALCHQQQSALCKPLVCCVGQPHKFDQILGLLLSCKGEGTICTSQQMQVDLALLSAKCLHCPALPGNTRFTDFRASFAG